MTHRNLDDLAEANDHATPVHPLRALIENNFYLDRICCTEGGLWILLMDALLFVPLVMAAFFYPWQALTVAVVLLVLSFVGYEGYVIWHKRHPDFHW
jgi:hypothetical protein